MMGDLFIDASEGLILGIDDQTYLCEMQSCGENAGKKERVVLFPALQSIFFFLLGQGKLLSQRWASHASGQVDASRSFPGRHLHFQDRHLVNNFALILACGIGFITAEKSIQSIQETYSQLTADRTIG